MDRAAAPPAAAPPPAFASIRGLRRYSQFAIMCSDRKLLTSHSLLISSNKCSRKNGSSINN